MLKFLLSAAALGALALGAAAAIPVASPASAGQPGRPDVSCEVRLKRTYDGVRLEALVHAMRPASGEYQLVVTMAGPGGSSDVSQGGEFVVEGGSTAVLGTAEFGLQPRARLKARLVLSDRRGPLCDHEVAT